MANAEGNGLTSGAADNACPGCGVVVPCGIAAGGTTCWCMAPVGDEGNAASAGTTVRLPLPEVGARCYCPACLEKLKAGQRPG